MDEYENKKIVNFAIISSHGSDDIERCYAPYAIASTAAAVGHNVTIFHMMDAVELGVEGTVEKINAPPPMPPLKEIVEQAVELGVKVEVCENSAAFRQITKDKLRKGIDLTDVLGMVNLLAEADRTIWI